MKINYYKAFKINIKKKKGILKYKTMKSYRFYRYNQNKILSEKKA